MHGGGYEAGYAQGRIPSKANGMSRHIQLEANLSLTGANADERIALTPDQVKKALAYCFQYLKGFEENEQFHFPTSIIEKEENKVTIEDKIKKIASELKKAGSKALVVTGIDSVEAQLIAFAINEHLQSEAFSPQTPVLTRKGNVKALQQLLTDMNEGKVGALFINNLNPLYSLPNAEEFTAGLKKVPFSLSFAMRADETAQQTTLWAPQPHYLESWGDVEFKYGHYGLMQPCIRPLFNTRQWQDCFLQWAGHKESYYHFIKVHWEAHILKEFSWEQALHDGTFVKEDLKSFELPKEEKIPSLRKPPMTLTREETLRLIGTVLPRELVETPFG